MNVVLLRFSALGDVVLTAPAVEALKRALPEARIDYAIRRGSVRSSGTIRTSTPSSS